MEKERIAELDILRGILVIGMILVHLGYDLRQFAGIDLQLPFWAQAVGDHGHLAFILLSGICITFSRNPLHRGLQVFVCGLLVSYGTFYGELVLGLPNIRIFWGILHLLGFSMIVYSALRKAGYQALLILGILMIWMGSILSHRDFPFPYLFPLGIRMEGFYPGSDYFPAFPFLGWFLLGSAAGKCLYRDQKPLLPFLTDDHGLGAAFSWIGRHALPIYLIHQPILLTMIFLFA